MAKKSLFKRVSILLHRKPFVKQLLILGIISGSLFIFYALLYRPYMSRANSFGCFDDCMNFGGAYFMQQGRQLYSEVFFNHQPIMAYLSYGVLEVFKPASIFELLLNHKQFLFLFGFLSSIFIIRRFLWAGALFVLFYETTKFYLFGDRFIAESFIIYPLVYLTGLVWYRFQNKKIFPVEYIAAAFLTWFVVFSREPYVPLAGIEFLLLLGIPKTRLKQISYAFFALLSIATFLIQPINEYLYSIFYVSLKGPGSDEITGANILGLGILKILFYPLFVFFGGVWNEFRVVLVGTSTVFMILLGIEIKKKQYKLVFLVLVILSLANIRVVEPGVIFYGAFHMIQWFGLFLLFTGLLLYQMKHSKRTVFFLSGILIVTFFAYFFHPQTFLRKQANPEQDFLTSYGQTLEISEVVKLLSTPGQTFYIDYSDDLNLSYWQAGRLAPYKYSWYVYVAPGFERYETARRDMFKNSPPDFLYGILFLVSKEIYTPLYKNGKNSHLYIKKSLVNRISEEQWEKAGEFGYTKSK